MTVHEKAAVVVSAARAVARVAQPIVETRGEKPVEYVVPAEEMQALGRAVAVANEHFDSRVNRIRKMVGSKNGNC